jgi:hypothetical protein
VKFDDNITVGQKYKPAMEITGQAEADEYFERCVEHAMRFGNSRRKAERIERISLSFYAGYYDAETRARVERLFRCAHTIFGAIAEKGPPTAEEAFALGEALASTKH